MNEQESLVYGNHEWKKVRKIEAEERHGCGRTDCKDCKDGIPQISVIYIHREKRIPFPGGEARHIEGCQTITLLN